MTAAKISISVSIIANSNAKNQIFQTINYYSIDLDKFRFDNSGHTPLLQHYYYYYYSIMKVISSRKSSKNHK